MGDMSYRAKGTDKLGRNSKPVPADPGHNEKRGKSSMKFKVYQDVQKQYRWTLYASNGRKLADSGEGYNNKNDCLSAIQSIKNGAATAPVEDTTLAPASRS